MTRKLTFLGLVLTILLIPMAAAAARGTVPLASDNMASDIDKQILSYFGVEQPGLLKQEQRHEPREIRRALSIACTVPVNLNNLESSSPIARQVSEEMARWFVNAGYRVHEIRKGQDVYFDLERGERLLTRDVKKLLRRDVQTEAVLAGTFVVTHEQVRFSMRLLHVPSNEILGMATATIPISDDIKGLVTDPKEAKVAPSIGTKLK